MGWFNDQLEMDAVLPLDIQQLRHGIFVRPTAATKVMNLAAFGLGLENAPTR